MEISILIRADSKEELSIAIHHIAANIKNFEEMICDLDVDQCVFLGYNVEVNRAA